MGVKNLWDVFESCKKTLPLHHLRNKRICVDLSCWMVQLRNASKSHSCVKEKVYLRGLFHRLRALMALNCSLILVTDGSIPAIKISTYRRRLNLITEVKQDEINPEKASLRRNKGSEFSCMIKEAKILGMALGIPCLDGIEEAEAQCALLNSESLCDGCFSSDSDIFLFGARTVYRDICLGDGGYVVCYEMSDIERQLGFGRNSLITLGLLLGSDYIHGVHGLGRETACQIVKSIGDDVVLQKVASEGLSFAKKKKKESKKLVQNMNDNKENSLYLATNTNGSKNCSAKEYSYVEVVNAYLNPKCHSADSDAVYGVLVQQPYQHVKVQQACSWFFEWPPEKTDEYILPKIAERELRRFAKLRLTSSELGVKLPLDKMPVKCPVSGIVKQRKVYGKECYEVLWDDIHGLKTSLVPADLIRSACPEKIVEFEEEKALKKKQNCRKARPRKSADESSLSDIDQRLQGLLLDIVTGSNSPLSSSTIVKSKNGETVVDDNPTETITVVNKEWGSCKEEEGQTDSGGKYEKEIIDLLSPSPPRLQCKTITKQQEIVSDQVIVNVSSDSETEISPEHARKARELRLFLAGIKD